MQENEIQAEPKGFVKWIKRLGVAGFMFFLIKGLLWLTVPALLVWFGVSC